MPTTNNLAKRLVLLALIATSVLSHVPVRAPWAHVVRPIHALRPTSRPLSPAPHLHAPFLPCGRSSTHRSGHALAQRDTAAPSPGAPRSSVVAGTLGRDHVKELGKRGGEKGA